MDAEELEPFYIHEEYILESCLMDEAQRVAHTENLMNRIVYDRVPPDPVPEKKESPRGKKADSPRGGKRDEKAESPREKPFPSALNCDNNENFEEYYKPTSKTDFTLQFESRFESANLRRAVQVYVFEYDLILSPDY